jgi:hypothetical protein
VLLGHGPFLQEIGASLNVAKIEGGMWRGLKPSPLFWRVRRNARDVPLVGAEWCEATRLQDERIVFILFMELAPPSRLM